MSAEPDHPADDDGIHVDDMELAYREAMKALDEAELQIGTALLDVSTPVAGDSPSDDRVFVSIGDELAGELEAEGAATAGSQQAGSQAGDPRISPREVIVAALFVGGDVSLTARKLATLIGKDTEARVAVRIIDQLNEAWSRENRPYEIQLHEGGFQLQLREDFRSLPLQMFGMGPREVRLSPEVLEILAFVAYNQPVSKEDLASTGNARAMSYLRQLIRLELVEVVRTGDRRTDVAYQTAPRFLELFGLNDISDLPQADVFSFK
ncbi:MAG: SMC-Scp complex subunit ScpB [Planctomycetaceae bacterium]